MAEADLSGMGFPSSEGSGAGGVAGVFRANSKISLDYKDVTGLVKEMTALADAVTKVKKAIDSLDESKTRTALATMRGAVSGGGPGGPPGGGGGGRGPNGGGPTFGGVGPGMQMAAVGLGAAAMLAGAYAQRKQSDLMSDITSQRVTLASGNPSFGLNQANALVRNTLGPTSFGRDDMNQAAQSIFGRYGTAASGGTKAALTTSAALARVTGQGATFGADLMNSANDPSVLGALRLYTGKTIGQFGSSTQMSQTLVQAAFRTAHPTQGQLDNFRPGMGGYVNMMALTGGNAALGQAAVDEYQMKNRYYANGGKGPWNDKTIANMSDSMQKKIFGADSLAIAVQKRAAGRAMSQEQGLALSRSGLVGSEEYLYGIQQATKEVSQKLTQYLAPLGDKIGGMSAMLGQLGQILTPLALLGKTSGGISGMLGTIGLGKGAAAAAEGKTGLAGLSKFIGPAGEALGAAALGNMGGSLLGDQLNRLTGRKQGQKGGVNWGNIVARGGSGALAGASLGGPWGALIGGGVGVATGLAHEIFHIGDPVWPGGQDLSGDQSHGSSDSKMSLTDATNLLISRNRASGGADAVNNMQPDLRMKLGKLFSSNKALVLNSGWRSRKEQQRLYDLYKSGKGNMAAKPGTSNHEKGLAADIGPTSQYGWLSKAGKDDGLVRPMSSEPWHWEPPGASARAGTGAQGSTDGADPSSSLGGALLSAARSAMGVGGALQWVGSDSAPALSGVALTATAGGGGTSVGAAGSSSGGMSGSMSGLSINAIARLAAGAGIPAAQIQTAVAIALAESGGVPGKHNPVPPDDSYGLWQINMIGGMGPERRKKYHLSADSQLYDPKTNAAAMADISNHGRNWGQWSTYTDGKGHHLYQQYMKEVGSALSSGVGDPVASPAPAPSFGAGGMSVHGGGTRNVTINVTVMQASEAEAMRFAKIIKTQLDGPMADVAAARVG